MKCIKCKKKIPDKSKFCNYCGTKQEKQKFYRRSDGLYEKILNIDGKRVAFRAKTEDEVWTKIRQYNEKKERGVTFEEAADLWHTDHWYTLSPTTQRGYKFAYEEVIEYFGTDYIKQITHKDINRYIKQLPATYARKTCATRLLLLNMIFKHAIIEDLCEINPCEYVSIPKEHGSKKRRAPTEKEIARINASLGILYHNFDVGLLAVFFLYTGCRKGEALALQYRDINRKTARLSVTKSLFYVHNEGKIKNPKTEAGTREIIIPSFLLKLLPTGKPTDYVFSPTPAEPMRGHFFDKAWKLWKSETGLDLTAHQLRHGYASILLEAEVGAKDAQDQLGHADISTTMNRYTEVSEKRRKSTEEKINTYLQQ